ncbi:NACHT, LRR and PYD domains-containing protein 10-like 5 [Homarus americanus]|uniref:NACHT, LRR and PYD domains-containing protein 10-like 5 n=1 Tax=Homarus americanus TaxID=6706 RepID=A0A8J5J9J9_HOMAM|nr:NACHT, LRR and PYD domains-containing protein 10-like 5 [Homarus americanus]
MSFERSDDGLGVKDYRFFRLYKVINCEARETMYSLYLWGCKKKLDETLKEYLERDGVNKSNYKSLFHDKIMRNRIENDAAGNTFDVSLLYACIKSVCTCLANKDSPVWHEGDDTKLESICTAIKNFRNNLIHSPPEMADDAEMNSLLKKLEDWLEKALQLGGNLYKISGIEVCEKIRNMKSNINKIMNNPLTMIDIDKYKKEVEMLRENKKKIVILEGIPELAYKYKNKSKIDPASFITGKERLQVKKVFTQLEIIKEQQDDTFSCPSVDYKTMLELKTQSDKKPRVILLEGEAGAGKTTLTKLILDDWVELKDSGDTEFSPIFQGLKSYDLVLYTEARNKSLSSFLSLLTVLMSQASYKMEDSDLVRSVLNLNVLLIIDGLDEMNEASGQLIREVFDKHIPGSNGMLQLLVTTRPNMLPDIPTLLHNEPRVHILIKGVTQENRVEFVSKLHDEMLAEGQSKQKTQDLIDFMKQSQTRLGEQYRLPLNLTLVTYLFASDPDRINLVTSSTGLYIAMHELIQSRLLNRLKDQGEASAMPTCDLGDKCQKFLKKLYHVCFVTHSSGHIQLSSESTDLLKNECEKLKLKHDEMYSAFLAVEREWTPGGYKLDLFVPHKSIMEFYAAYQIFISKFESSDEELLVKEMQQLLIDSGHVSKEDQDKILMIIKGDNKKSFSIQEIMENLLESGSDLGKLTNYQNVLLYLSGLIAYNHPDKLKHSAVELVDLLDEANVQNKQWLDIVAETNCDDVMTDLVSKKIYNQLVVRDGHTKAALKMFDCLSTNVSVQVILENEVCFIPYLEELIDKLSGRKCHVEFLLKHQWKHSQYGTSDTLLKNLTKEKGENRCRVIRFTGHLEDLTVLPKEIENLRITISNNYHATAIGVHVMMGVSPEMLQPLPVVKSKNKEVGTLWISDVKVQMEWACNVARKLLPEGGQYCSIMFPRSLISFDNCKDLLKRLQEMKVKVRQKGGIRLYSPGLTAKQQRDLREMAKEKLDCVFYCTADDSSMW